MVEDSAEWVEIPSHAKVNLYLDVLGKREDGFHEIVSLVQTISFHDVLRVRMKDGGLEIRSTADIPGVNTIEKAVVEFKRATGYEFGLEVSLVKRIPMRAGFGGGSSNAGAILRFLGELFGLEESDLVEIAARVGSDVPFFIKGGTAIIRGRGEIVEFLDPLPDYGVVLALPSVRMDTRRAYSLLRDSDFGKGPCDVEELYRAYSEFDFEKIVECSYNVFQEILGDYYLEIGLTLKFLKEGNPIVALMTGSGTGCFSVFEPGRGTFQFVPSSSSSSSSRLVL